LYKIKKNNFVKIIAICKIAVKLLQECFNFSESRLCPVRNWTRRRASRNESKAFNTDFRKWWYKTK